MSSMKWGHVSPKRRTEGVIESELPDELLVYDLERHRAHALNRTAALVWKACDGRRTVGEIANVIGRELGRPVDERLVRLALRQLGERWLLEGMASAGLVSKSRRELFQKAAAGAVLIPLARMRHVIQDRTLESNSPLN